MYFKSVKENLQKSLLFKNTFITIALTMLSVSNAEHSLALSNKALFCGKNSAEVKLVVDKIEEFGKLRNYRVPMDACNNEKFKNVDITGFCELKMSGSSQISEKELAYLLQKSQGRLMVVDLRAESHGFVDAIPVTLFSYRNQYNVNKSPQQIYKEETTLMQGLSRCKVVAINDIKKQPDGSFIIIKTLKKIPKKSETEEEMLLRNNVGYQRFHVLDRHKPNNKQVDKFVTFIKTLPQDVWLHFHCRAGKGRTTTFMVMYDIIKNASNVALEDILKRHNLLGGSNFNKLPIIKKYKWKIPQAIKRLEFIKAFYKYVKSGNINKKTWSEWVSCED